MLLAARKKKMKGNLVYKRSKVHFFLLLSKTFREDGIQEEEYIKDIALKLYYGVYEYENGKFQISGGT